MKDKDTGVDAELETILKLVLKLEKKQQKLLSKATKELVTLLNIFSIALAFVWFVMLAALLAIIF